MCDSNERDQPRGSLPGPELQQPTTYWTTSTMSYNPHNTRFRTQLKPEQGDVLRFTKLRALVRGGQGDV